MSEEHRIEHVETVEREPVEPEPAGEEVVEPAAAAVALAEATAAAAELDAGERMRRFEEDAASWRDTTSRDVLQLNENLRQLREEELQRHETERLVLAESLSALSSRVELIEAHPNLSTRPPPPEEETPATPAENGANPNLIGASGEASLGPAEAQAGAGLRVATETAESPSPSRPLRKRLWI